MAITPLAAQPRLTPGRSSLPFAALTRHQVARMFAAVFGALALVGFFQPWVVAELPGVGKSVLTGQEIARGDAAERVDAASGPLTGGSSLGGLVLPTRISTPLPGSAGSASGLVLPTRIAPVGPQPTAPPVSVGGLVLPTRIATAAPGGQGTGAGVAIATAAAATSIAFQTAQAGALPGTASDAPVFESAPDRLPGLSLYGVPLAAAGLAIFAAVWGRFREPRDQLFGKLWTVLLAVGGAIAAGNILLKISTAAANNNLLAPGDVKQPLWGLWGTLIAFVLAGISLAAAWLLPSRPPGPERTEVA